MKKDIRKEILNTAKELFDAQGYNNVSMRNIADGLGISVGNLTYHFKKKEELIEEIVLRQNWSRHTHKVSESLLELHQYFKKVIAYHAKNAYYFRHYTQFSQISSKVYERQIQVRQHQTGVLRQSFQKLEQGGYMKPEEIEGQREDLIHVLSMINAYWLSARDVIENVREDSDALQLIWTTIYPWLTETGKKVFREEIRNQI